MTGRILNMLRLIIVYLPQNFQKLVNNANYLKNIRIKAQTQI